MSIIRQIKTFDWSISMPVTAPWEIQGGFAQVADSSIQVFWMTPCRGSHVKAAGVPYAAVLTMGNAFTFDITKGAQAAYWTAIQCPERSTFFDSGSVEWLRLHSLDRHLTDTTYATIYVRKFEEWCKAYPREAWALTKRMSAGSNLRNEFTKQIIGTTNKPPISLDTINEDLWRHAEEGERLIRREAQEAKDDANRLAYCQQDSDLVFSMLQAEQDSQAASDHAMCEAEVELLKARGG